jgi:hypothetical protein
MKTIKEYKDESSLLYQKCGGVPPTHSQIDNFWVQAIKEILEEVVGEDFDENNDYRWKGKIKDIQVFAYNQAKDEIRTNAAKVLGE